MYTKNGKQCQITKPATPFPERKYCYNTILLSKLWYVCSVFPLPKNLIPEINKIIFKFLWNNKNPEPIARETLFFPRERGSLGILVPSIESQALRIKYLMKLGKENNNNIWTYLGRYWVASKIHNFTPEWNFLKKTTILKTRTHISQPTTTTSSTLEKHIQKKLKIN